MRWLMSSWESDGTSVIMGLRHREVPIEVCSFIQIAFLPIQAVAEESSGPLIMVPGSGLR